MSLTRIPVASGPRPAAAWPEAARRLTHRARMAAAPRAAGPGCAQGRSRARRGRGAACLGNRLNDTRSEEAGTYRRKGQAGGRALGTGDRRTRNVP